MRSPWAVAAAVLAWLGLAGALGEGPGDVVSLWVLGLVFAMVCLRASKRRATDRLAPDPIEARHIDYPTPAMTDSGVALDQQPPASNDSTRVQFVSDELDEGASYEHDNAASPPRRTPDSAPRVVVAPAQTGDEGPRGNRRQTVATVVGTDTLGAEVMTAADVARWLGVPVEDVVAAMESGHMPGNKLGTEWRAAHEAVRRWLDGRWTAAQVPERSPEVEPQPPQSLVRRDRP